VDTFLEIYLDANPVSTEELMAKTSPREVNLGPYLPRDRLLNFLKRL
jgi:hypothetical protein